jgi:hypothetical protein
MIGLRPPEAEPRQGRPWYPLRARDSPHVAAYARVRLRAKRRWGELLGEPKRGGDTTGASDRSSDADYKSRERDLSAPI